MAYLSASVTYPSHRQFKYLGRGGNVKIFFDRIDWRHRGTRYYIRTYSGMGKPERGTPGLGLELDEETMQAVLAALNKMIAEGPNPI